MKMCWKVCLCVLFFTPPLLGELETEFSEVEFKCALPDVKSDDDKLDVTRFRMDFSKISEVKFPGLIGPLNERLICKIKCIDGNWVGPLCSTTPNGRFQPVLRECLYRHDHPLLAISFKNSTITKDTMFPHGAVVVARCTHFGLYKLKGAGALRCENGRWAPAFPECVPTSLLTNFTGDAPPSIQYHLLSGSASVEPSGELFVYPDSSLRLECASAHALGDPLWSWTQSIAHYHSEWSTEVGEDSLYRLTLSKMSVRNSDHYTCTTPGGTTNTIYIKVVSVSCPPLSASGPHVRQHSQGSRLGHAAHFSCQPGYHLAGEAMLTCMGDGRWSGEGPRCEETFCPALGASLGAHLSVLEYNASFGGRAVFQCAWGYRLVGAPGLECEAAGEWSGDAPVCLPIYCPEPLIPENGRLLTAPSRSGKFSVGDLMTYACCERCRALGEASIVCTENGFWSHPPPFCIPHDPNKTDTIYIENSTMIHLDED